MQNIQIEDQISNCQNYDPSALEAANTDELAALVSYELRTPLTSIRGALGLLLSGQLGPLPKQTKRLLEIAVNNTDRLVRLTAALEKEQELHPRILNAAAMARFQIEKDLRLALARQEFQLYYQPIVHLETSEITGFEALARWQHPQRGMISPIEFIPIAEETGLIQPLGTWVLREACHQLYSWQKEFPSHVPLTMSVNISSQQLSQPNLVEQVQQILQESPVATGSLRLEITESMIMENQVTANNVLHQLKNLGIVLYIDDFGTGYSSLSRLHELPIDVMKIDRSFIKQKKWDIIWAMMILAYSLGLEVIAEGLETEEEIRSMKNLGCNLGQGYFYSQPIDAQSAGALIAN